MKRSQLWQGLAGLTLLMLAIISGCTRNLTVAPTSAGATATNTTTAGLTSTFTRTTTRTYTATPTNTVAGNTATSTATSTVTRTATATASATNTNTNVPGATDTYTSTMTATPTVTSTLTPTLSATNTNTNVPGATNTNTSTVTSTPTVTVTSTPTVAQCSEGTLQTAYPFDVTLGCWYIEPSTASIVTTFDVSTTTHHNGAGSMHAAVTIPASAKNLQFQLDYTTAQNLTGLTLTAWVYVDAGLASSNTGIQFYGTSGTGSTWFNGGGIGLGTAVAGKWNYMSWPIAATDITQVQKIGLQIYNLPANGTGNVYIDDVKLVAGLCNASSIQTSFTYESSLNCWSIDSSSVDVVPDWGVTVGGPAHSGTGAMYATVNQGASSSNTQFDMNFSPDQNMTGMSFSYWVYVDASLIGASVQPYIKSGGSSGTSSWSWLNGTSTTFDATNTGKWVNITFSPVVGAGWSAAAYADVIMYGLQFYGVPASAVGKIYLDDVTVISAGPTNTPTITSTPTITMTPVDTNTPIPGSTDTFTVTSTVTSTMTLTPTATVTACNASAYQALYTFDSSFDCWGINAGAAYLSGWDLSAARTHSGSGKAFHLGVNNTTAGTVQIAPALNFSPNADLTGKEIVAWLYVDASLADASGWSTAVQPYDQSGATWGSAVFEDKWFNLHSDPANLINVGTWFPVTLVLGDAGNSHAGTVTPAQILQIGFQFTVMGNSTGNIYVDDVQIIDAPVANTATPTITPTTANTATVTNTPVNTDTPIPGATDTFTSTVTSTPTVTMTVTATATPSGATPCVVLMENFETVDDNGSWVKDTATSVGYTSAHATLGSQALQITLAGGASNMVDWTGFAPKTWTNVTKVVMDIYVDASLIAGTYHQLQLVESSAAGGYWSAITPNTDVVAGAQSVTFTVDWTQGTLNATSVMSKLITVWNTDSTGAGSIYIDNIRLVGSVGACPPTPPTTCGLIDSFETSTENGSWVKDAAASVGYTSTHATLGSQALQITLAGGASNMVDWTGFAPSKWPDVTQVIMDVYVDASLIAGTYHQLQLVESSAAGGWWSAITPNTDVVAGAQSVTFTIDWSQGTLTSASTLSKLITVWNTDSTGAGSIYIDNIRLKSGASCNP